MLTGLTLVLFAMGYINGSIALPLVTLCLDLYLLACFFDWLIERESDETVDYKTSGDFAPDEKENELDMLVRTRLKLIKTCIIDGPPGGLSKQEWDKFFRRRITLIEKRMKELERGNND